MLKTLLSKVVPLVLISFILFSTLSTGVQQGATIAGTIEISDDHKSPQKLAWDGSSLWVSNQNTETIYQVDPSSGKVTDSFDTGLESPYGIESNGSNMWVVSRDFSTDTQKIHEYNTTTGEQINKIPAPGDQPAGIAYDGSSLWVAAEGQNGRETIFQLNPKTGTVISSIESSAIDYRGGLAWGKGFLWGISSEKIVQIDPSTPSGEPVREIDSSYYTPVGIAWDGQDLWLSEGSNYTVTRINPGKIGQTNVPPNASFRYSPKQPTVGSQISFDASISSDSNGFVKSYQWDFDGDGVSDAQGQRATHTFNSPGKHSVNLTVKDDNGVKGSTTKEITVASGSKSVPETRNARNANTSPTHSTSTPTTTPSESASSSATFTKQPPISGGSEAPATNQTQSNISSKTENVQKERGFLVNGNGFDLFDFLINPLPVTIAGFVASILGILLQLLGGR